MTTPIPELRDLGAPQKRTDLDAGKRADVADAFLARKEREAGEDLGSCRITHRVEVILADDGGFRPAVYEIGRPLSAIKTFVAYEYRKAIELASRLNAAAYVIDEGRR